MGHPAGTEMVWLPKLQFCVLQLWGSKIALLCCTRGMGFPLFVIGELL